MHPVVAYQVAKSVVNERVKRAEMVRLAQQARAAQMSERGEQSPNKAEKLLSDARQWFEARIASPSAS
jgi:hypothetical protein